LKQALLLKIFIETADPATSTNRIVEVTVISRNPFQKSQAGSIEVVDLAKAFFDRFLKKCLF